MATGRHADPVRRRVSRDVSDPGPGDHLPQWRSVLAVVAHPEAESFGLGAVPTGFAEAGWIRADPATLATGFEGVYAIGDNTHIVLGIGKPLPRAGYSPTVRPTLWPTRSAPTSPASRLLRACTGTVAASSRPAPDGRPAAPARYMVTLRPQSPCTPRRAAGTGARSHSSSA